MIITFLFCISIFLYFKGAQERTHAQSCILLSG
jgi:hypothetical protein